MTPSDLLAPIPQLEVSGWKDVPIVENHDSLVPIGPFTGYPTLFTNSIYFGERIDSPYRADKGNELDGAFITIFARRSVADRLLVAQTLLPPGHRFVVYDAYRSLQVQRALYDHYLESLRESTPKLSDDALSAQTQKYTAIPSSDPTRPSPHNTGGSVDLAVVRLSSEDEARIREIDQELAELPYETDWSLFSRRAQDPYAEPDTPAKKAYLLEMERMLIMRDGGELLDYGTPFDWGGPEAALRYYEEPRSLSSKDSEPRDNRRLQHNALAAAGFAGYLEEWWHVNAPESQSGAQALGLPRAHFGGQELGEAHLEFEDMRRRHHASMLEQFERVASGEPHIPPGYRPEIPWVHELQRQALQHMLERNAHPSSTKLRAAAIIAVPVQV